MTRYEAVQKILKLALDLADAEHYMTAAGLAFLASAVDRGEERELTAIMEKFGEQSDSAHEFFALAERYRLKEKPNDEASKS